MIRPHWLILPDPLPCGRIERPHIGLPWRVRCFDVPGPGIRRRARRDEVDAAAFRDGHVAILGVGTVGRRRPVRRARRGWAGPRPAHGGIMTRYDDRPSLRVQAVRPVYFTYKRSANQKLTVGAVKNVIKSVAVGLKEQLTGLPVERGVDEH